MGHLIVLPLAERPSPRAPISGRSAEILFFTGVRYYRVTDETASPAAKPRRRRAAEVASRIDRLA